MRWGSRTSGAAALVVVITFGVGCQPKPTEGDGVGVVRAIGAGGTTVTLEHGEIPGLMRAMTMEFAVAQPAQLEGLEPGDPVAFRLVYEDGTYRITELRQRSP